MTFKISPKDSTTLEQFPKCFAMIYVQFTNLPLIVWNNFIMVNGVKNNPENKTG